MEQRDLGSPDLRIHYLRVTNTGDTDFTDMFDGVPITIEHGRAQNLQLDMAMHLFGYHYGVKPDEMFRHTCKRQGWNTKPHLEKQKNGKTLAENLFGKFEFKPVIYKMIEEKPDLDSPIPADPPVPTEARRKAGAA